MNLKKMFLAANKFQNHQLNNLVVTMAILYSSNYIIVDRALSLTLELIMLPIFVFYAWDCLKFIRKMFKKKKKALSSRDILTKSSLKYRKAVHVFSLLTLLIYSSQGCNYVLNAFSLYPKSFSCDVIKKFSVLGYHLGKCCLYIVLIFRVKIVFSGSTFQNNMFVRNALYAIYFLTFAFFCVAVFGDILTITGSLVFATDNKKMYYCLLDEIATWGFLTFIILDSVIRYTLRTIYQFETFSFLAIKKFLLYFFIYSIHIQYTIYNIGSQIFLVRICVCDCEEFVFDDCNCDDCNC